MAFNVTVVLEWSALAVALSWFVGCWSILAGARRAKRAFRGNGYLRPPETGRETRPPADYTP